MPDVDAPPKVTPAKVDPASQGSLTPAAAMARAPTRFGRPGAVLLALATLAVLAGGGYFAWQQWIAEDSSATGMLTGVVMRGNLEDTITATGTLQPKAFVDVGTQVSGQLQKLHVDIGAVVKTGQLLAEIDPSVYQSKVDGDRAQLLNQQAQLADRQAQLTLADLQLTRQQNLTREDATSADALQSAEAARKSGAAQIDAIKAQMLQTGSTLRGDEANLGYTKIYAPIAGTVVSQAIKQGQTLNANQQAPIVMRIADLSTMTVQAQVSEADVPKLHVGMDVYFTTLGGDKRRFYSKLRKIQPTPTVLNNVVLYDALFDVANPNQALMTQMTAQVFFVLSSATDAVLVPLTALHPITGESGRRGPRTADGASADGKERTRRAARTDGVERLQRGARNGGEARPAEAADKDGDRGTTSITGKGGDERVPGTAATGGDQTLPGAARSGGDERAPGGAGKGSSMRASGADSRSQFANGRAMVSVVDADGEVTQREVRVGVMNRVSAQILSGLEPGEKVVIGTKAPVTAVRAQNGSSLVPSAGKGGGRP